MKNVKYFIWRVSFDGFQDWIHSILDLRKEINRRSCCIDEEDRERVRQADYWYRIYLIYMNLCNEQEKAYIKAIENHHIPDYDYNHTLDLKKLYYRWELFVGRNDNNRLDEISNKEVGQAIKTARENKCITRKKLADILGLRPETLKAYENGIRTLPFDIYFKVKQLLNLRI